LPAMRVNKSSSFAAASVLKAQKAVASCIRGMGVRSAWSSSCRVGAACVVIEPPGRLNKDAIIMPSDHCARAGQQRGEPALQDARPSFVFTNERQWYQFVSFDREQGAF